VRVSHIITLNLVHFISVRKLKYKLRWCITSCLNRKFAAHTGCSISHPGKIVKDR